MLSGKAIYIVGAKRTPFGAFGGSLAKVSAVDLGVIATKGALGDIDPNIIDQCYFGNVIQTGNDAAYLARHIALKSGTKISTPALTINRLCGSGFESVIQGVNAIQVGIANTVIAGGTENMSSSPFIIDGNDIRYGVSLGTNVTMKDSLWNGLTDNYTQTPMGITAENLAKQYNISRDDCDHYAIRSQQTWKKANDAGVFHDEIVPIENLKKKGKTFTMTSDEHPRPETLYEKINTLRPVFIPNTGVVTAANASGICDGAGSIIVASEDAVREHNLQPLARIVSYGITGCDPKIMGIGPVSAIKLALKNANLTLNDMNRIEINEAFAAQFLACSIELGGLNMDTITNINGGAISIGHPLGASGSRIIAHLTHQFQYYPNNKYHIGSACIGGGQGIAILLERC